jgi:hypothetical protein
MGCLFVFGNVTRKNTNSGIVFAYAKSYLHFSISPSYEKF